MICAAKFQRELLLHGIWANWAIAAISDPVFATTARNLRSDNEKTSLLKRYKDLDYTGAFTQRFERFANNRAEHATPVGALPGPGFPGFPRKGQWPT